MYPRSKFTPSGNAIILLGSSQSGKSTLANWLTCRDEIKSEQGVFDVGDGWGSRTKDIKVVQTSWFLQYNERDMPIRSNIAVIDTPGLLDSNRDDDTHIFKIVNGLNRLNNAGIRPSLAILVVKYPTMLSDEYFESLNVYRGVIDELFERNLILVITNVEETQYWLKRERRSRRNPKQLIGKIITKFKDKLNLAYNLTVLTINSLPDPDDEVDYLNSKSVRDLILERALKGTPMDMNLIQIPKSHYWIKRDQNELKVLKTDRSSYIKGLEEGEKRLGNLARKMGDIQDMIEQFKNKKSIMENRLKRIDNENESVTFERLYQEQRVWNPFVENANTEFLINLTYKKSSYQINGCKKKQIIMDTDYLLQGKVVAGFWSQLNCTVRVFSKNNIINEKEIELCKQQILEMKDRILDKEKDLNEFMKESKEIDDKVEKMKLELERIGARISFVSKPSLTKEEFLKESKDQQLKESAEFPINFIPFVKISHIDLFN